MASSLSQVRVICSTMKMSSFPLEIEKNIQAMKNYRFYSIGESEIEEILYGSATFASRDQPLLWSFSRFWSSFNGIEVSSERKNSILRILYRYSL